MLCLAKQAGSSLLFTLLWCPAEAHNTAGGLPIWRMGAIFDQWQVALHIQLPASFLYHVQLHQSIPRLWPHLLVPSRGPFPISVTVDRTPSVWDAPCAPSSGPTSQMTSSSWWFPPAPDRGHPCLLWVLRACLALKSQNQLLDQLHWLDCDCASRVLPSQLMTIYPPGCSS